MIFGVSPQRRMQQSQEKVSAFSTAIVRRLDDLERLAQGENCTGAWAAVFQVSGMLTTLARERTRAGLMSEGPFGVQAAARLEQLRNRVDTACGGALAYERRR